METNYKQRVVYLQFLKSEIESNLDESDVEVLESQLRSLNKSLEEVDECKQKYVNECLANEIDVLEWVESQKPLYNEFKKFRKEIKIKIDELKIAHAEKVMRHQLKIEEEISQYKEKLEIERNKRIAEQQQKINSLLQTEITELTVERNTEQENFMQKQQQFLEKGVDRQNHSDKTNVKLQRLKITPFTGDIVDFVRFWSQFSVEIDQTNINDITKLNYLIELVQGSARNDILGLPHSPDGYAEAKKILEQTYGKETVVFRELVFQLESLPVIRYTTNKKLIYEFSQKFSRIIRTLKTMGKLDSVEGLIHSTFVKLGPVRENLAASSPDWEKWSLSDLAENLRRFVDRNSLGSEKGETESRYDRNKDKMLFNENKLNRGGQKCVFCDYTNHNAYKCMKVLEIQKRREIIRNKQLCYNCLKPGHMANKCRSRKCEKCNRSHHITVCDMSEKASIPVRKDFSEKSMGMLQIGCIHPTALVEVNGIPARVLFDTGASSSYICTDLLTKINIKPVRTEFREIEQLYEGIIKRKVEIFKIKLSSRILNHEINIEVGNSGKDILTYLPNYNISQLKKNYHKIRHIKFSDEEDPGSQEKLPVHIILGARDINKVKTLEPAIICKNDIVVEMTKLGWIISGGGHINPSFHEKFFLSSEEQFKIMTQMSLYGISDETDKNASFHNEYSDKLIQNANGRYVAPLPWKTDVLKLPENKQIALKRLGKNTDRLEKFGKLKDYDDIIKGQIEAGILERVPANITSSNGIHYIPHQAVIKESSETTKLRVVFDCSAKANLEQPSLNDCLETGPALQPHLFDILMRIRSYKYLILGDIEKAFHMIAIREKDIDAQRLFWYKNIEKREIEELRFTRVIFGSTASPYILGATLQKHCLKYVDKYPETAKALLENTYVDDVHCGSDSKSSLERFKRESIIILGEANMTLHKWNSNIKQLEGDLNPVSGENRPGHEEEYPTYAKMINNTKENETKILGLNWDKNNDTISINFRAKEANTNTITKRNILSYVHSIYDLLGLASPVTIIGKVIFSKTCLLKLRWDEKVPVDIAQSWIKFVEQLKKYPVMVFPRYIMSDQATHTEMHGFSDASITAICAMVYIVSFENKDIKHFLLVSKCRVAPKETSVPRLELIGALMLSKLMKHCEDNLKNLNFSRKVAWTDSTTVLCWLQSKGTYSRYVRNRVEKIKETPLDWNYVPTKDNPADIGSRGCYPNKITDNWFNGPDWIGFRENWPEQPHISDTVEAKTEMVKQNDKEIIMMEVASDIDHGPLHFLLDKPYIKMLRITAYVYRFIRSERGDRLIRTEEMENSEHFWIKYAQRSINMEEESNNLEEKDGIYYIAGRIVGYNPIFIPREHALAKSLVINAHRKTLHGGASSIMADVRKKFWIPKLRSLAKSVVHNCEKCKRYRVKPLAPPKTGKMPIFRTEFSPPFTVVGVDFAGPLLYKIGQKSKNDPDKNKCYIALFTCATTRAVYLKLCKSQTQEEFQHVLKEFVIRRGIPKTIVSDNAKTFHATSEWLKILKTDNDLNNFLVRQDIKWKFNLSRAPWWGGFFERLIGITKRALSKSIGKGYLSFQELETVLFDIESFMNNRPLTYQGEELEKPALTPNMFLRGNDSVCLEEDLDKLIEDSDITRRLAHIERCKNKLRYRWLDEYLHALHERHKIKIGESEDLPSIGAIVLLKEDIKDKAQWRIARVIKEIKGRDNQLRGYELKLGNGYTIQRPIQLVCPLELQAEVKIDNTEAKLVIQPERDRPKRLAKDVAKAKIEMLSENEDHHIIS